MSFLDVFKFMLFAWSVMITMAVIQIFVVCYVKYRAELASRGPEGPSNKTAPSLRDAWVPLSDSEMAEAVKVRHLSLETYFEQLGLPRESSPTTKVPRATC